MPSMLEYEPLDFRNVAVAASHRQGVDPDAAGSPAISYCVCLDGYQRTLRTCRYITLAHTAISLIALIASALVTFRGRMVGLSPVLGGVFFMGMCTWMTCANIIGRFPARRFIRRRLAAEGRPCGGGRWAAIEDAATYHQLKVMADDLALLFIDAASGSLRMEGLTHRYQILARDIFCLGAVDAKKSKGVRLDYRIGDTVLELVLIDQSIGDEVRRQVLGHQALLKRITEALFPGAPTSVATTDRV